MRALLLTIMLLSSAASAVAERNKLKPTDFEPLTSLPWKKPDATLEGVLNAIFREPNTDIRYPVLAEYLRTIPVGELGKAFDICIGLEGTQTPDMLVEFFLEIWAQREPDACWTKTKELFRLVGIEDGWLGYDSWQAEDRSPITVQDLGAIRASRFWLESSALKSFPLGVSHSSVKENDRVRIMKEFTAKWFDAFGGAGSWPGYERPIWPSEESGYRSHDVREAFEGDPDSARTGFLGGNNPRDQAASEIRLRRWLLADPVAALEVVEKAHGTKWPPLRERTEPQTAGPSVELFMIWAKADLPAMIRWAESLDIRKDELAAKAKGFLMSRVDAATRKRWLAEAKAADEKEDKPEPGVHRESRAAHLFETWALWEPKVALDFAATAKDEKLIREAIEGATWVAWGPANMQHCGLGAVKDFDFFSLPEKVRKELISDWSQLVMEGWGDIDIGETARYGLDFLLRSHYAPPKGLMAFFSGKDVYPDEGGMIDRTFCALRVWAVVKPDEMKAWIATQKDAEMRKALTWLLEHPWGDERKEKAAAKK